MNIAEHALFGSQRSEQPKNVQFKQIIQILNNDICSVSRRFVRKTFCQDRLRRFVRMTYCQDRLLRFVRKNLKGGHDKTSS